MRRGRFESQSSRGVHAALDISEQKGSHDTVGSSHCAHPPHSLSHVHFSAQSARPSFGSTLRPSRFALSLSIGTSPAHPATTRAVQRVVEACEHRGGWRGGSAHPRHTSAHAPVASKDERGFEARQYAYRPCSSCCRAPPRRAPPRPPRPPRPPDRPSSGCDSPWRRGYPCSPCSPCSPWTSWYRKRAARWLLPPGSASG